VVHGLAHHAREDLLQLGRVAGGGQRRADHVILQPEVLRVGPARAAQPQRHTDPAQTEVGHGIQAPLQLVEHVVEGGRRAGEHVGSADGHVRVVVLERQERRVQRTQAVLQHGPSP
jgi:hypothetical protein